MKQNSIANTATNQYDIGNITYVVKNVYDGTKTLTEAYNEIVLTIFRNKKS